MLHNSTSVVRVCACLVRVVALPSEPSLKSGHSHVNKLSPLAHLSFLSRFVSCCMIAIVLRERESEIRLPKWAPCFFTTILDSFPKINAAISQQMPTKKKKKTSHNTFTVVISVEKCLLWVLPCVCYTSNLLLFMLLIRCCHCRGFGLVIHPYWCIWAAKGFMTVRKCGHSHAAVNISRLFIHFSGQCVCHEKSWERRKISSYSN